MDDDNNIHTMKVNHKRIGSVESQVLFFAVCGPKFTKLSMHGQERLQFARPFYSSCFIWKIFVISCEVVRNLAKILMFLGC